MEIALGYDPFHTAVQQLREAAAELDAQRASLAREVDVLLDSGWRGDAATAFAEAWDDWLAGADDVVGALGSLAAAVDTSGRLLTRSDNEAGDAVAQIQARLSA